MPAYAHLDPESACQPLLDLATPMIYRRNPFRVLDISVRATPREVLREHGRRKMQERLGIAGSGSQRHPLALDPPPTVADVQAALERLMSPIDRLLDEVFWFWPMPGDSAHDEALAAMAMGDLEGAGAVWEGLASTTAVAHVATHNLAVLNHLLVLDHEVGATNGTDHRGALDDLDDRWRSALAFWRQAFADEGFWATVQGRVAELDDAQISGGFIRNARASLPRALLLINAKLAGAAAERSDVGLARRHTTLIHAAGYGEDLAERAVREAITPIDNRIRTAIDAAKTRWTAAPHRADRYLRELHEQGTTLLEVLDRILPAGHPLADGIHDTIADAILDGQIAFGRKTNAWSESIALLGLAQALARGTAMQSRLTENIQVLRDNLDVANDWYSTGYWDLPEKAIERLEAAGAQARSGNFDGAISSLCALDPGLGQPLRRCLSYALSLRGIRAGNEGVRTLNSESAVIERIMTRLRAAGEQGLFRLLGRRPSPQTPTHLIPPCLACGNGYYTSWVEFTYNDIPMFMCSNCNREHERELEERRRIARGHMGPALEYLLLAAEVDPADTGVRKSLQRLQETARGIGCPIPQTAGLKSRLGGSKTRRIPLSFTPIPADGICFFCGEGEPDTASCITLPMCGDARSVDLLFERGREYHHTEIVVPRCARCRDAHRELPNRQDAWRRARESAAHDRCLPNEVGDEAQAAKSRDAAQAALRGQQGRVAAAQASLTRAQSIGTSCDRCAGTGHWRQDLCRRCDRHVFRLGSWPRAIVTIAALAAAAAAAFVLYRDPSLTASSATLLPADIGLDADQLRWAMIGAVASVASLLAGLTLYGPFKLVQLRSRVRWRLQRRAELAERRAREIEQARQVIEEQGRVLGAVQAHAARAAADYTSAAQALAAAREQALAEFERRHPPPALPKRMRPESDYPAFERIGDLRGRGWCFGPRFKDDGRPASGGPVNVTGLVA